MNTKRYRGVGLAEAVPIFRVSPNGQPVVPTPVNPAGRLCACGCGRSLSRLNPHQRTWACEEREARAERAEMRRRPCSGDAEILAALPATRSIISQRTGISSSSVWNALRRLKYAGMVRCSNLGVWHRVEPAAGDDPAAARGAGRDPGALPPSERAA